MHCPFLFLCNYSTNKMNDCSLTLFFLFLAELSQQSYSQKKELFHFNREAQSLTLTFWPLRTRSVPWITILFQMLLRCGSRKWFSPRRIVSRSMSQHSTFSDIGIIYLFSQSQFFLQLEDSRHPLLKSVLCWKVREGLEKLSTEILVGVSCIESILLGCQGSRRVLELL